MTDTRTAWLLTRQWRDTAGGLELEFWCASDTLPVCVKLYGQEAVCFIERQSTALTPGAGIRRQAVELKRLDGTPVDALYFRQQRLLQQCRRGDVQLLESDVKPTDRFLMERFITAGISIEASFTDNDGYVLATDARLRPADVHPSLRTLAIDIETRANSRELYSIAAAPAPLTGADPTSGASPRGVVFMRGNGERVRQAGYDLHFLESERDVLEAFFDWLAVADPDILTGWAVVNFDLHFHRAALP